MTTIIAALSAVGFTAGRQQTRPEMRVSGKPNFLAASQGSQQAMGCGPKPSFKLPIISHLSLMAMMGTISGGVWSPSGHSLGMFTAIHVLLDPYPSVEKDMWLWPAETAIRWLPTTNVLQEVTGQYRGYTVHTYVYMYTHTNVCIHMCNIYNIHYKYICVCRIARLSFTCIRFFYFYVYVFAYVIARFATSTAQTCGFILVNCLSTTLNNFLNVLGIRCFGDF